MSRLLAAVAAFSSGRGFRRRFSVPRGRRPGATQSRRRTAHTRGHADALLGTTAPMRPEAPPPSLPRPASPPAAMPQAYALTFPPGSSLFSSIISRNRIEELSRDLVTLAPVAIAARGGGASVRGCCGFWWDPAPAVSTCSGC